MKISDQVLKAIEDAEAGKLEAGLLHACIVIDATAKKLFPSEKGVRKRYTACLRQYYWLIEPMLVTGINLQETVFSNVKLKSTSSPDLAEIVYEIFRCAHAHGDEIPSNFSVIPTQGNYGALWRLADGVLQMPDRIVWALLGVALFSKVNADQANSGNHYLSLGDEIFPLRDWWGREDDFRPIAARYNTIRIKLEGLDGFRANLKFKT